MAWKARPCLLLTLLACGRTNFDPLPDYDPRADADDVELLGDAAGDTDAVAAVSDANPALDGSTMTDAPAAAPPNDQCNNAIDTVVGGVYSGTTCGADNTLDLSCVVAGTPDVYYTFTSPAAGNYQFRVSNGFRLQFGTCPGLSGSCAGNLSVMFGGAGTKRDFGVEKSDGTCGAFTFEVN